MVERAQTPRGVKPNPGRTMKMRFYSGVRAMAEASVGGQQVTYVPK